MQELDACLEDVEDIDASYLLEIEEGKKSLGGKVYRGSFLIVVDDDLCSDVGTKIGAQQIHVLEMRAGVRRGHLGFLAIDVNAKAI
jgi:hypothetical protein